jgi:hypothetical protein
MNHIFTCYEIYLLEIIENWLIKQNVPLFHIPLFFETPCIWNRILTKLYTAISLEIYQHNYSVLSGVLS